MTQTEMMADDEEGAGIETPALEDEAILGYGALATEDRVTEYEGLAAGGKAPPRKARGSAVVLVAGGYPGFTRDADEIERLRTDTWFPNTPDFIATAERNTRSLHAASNVSEFIGALQGVKGSIATLTFIGHGTDKGLGLKGDTFAIPDEEFTSSDLATWKSEIETLRAKFAPGATIDIVACNVAVAGTFVRELAVAFDVCVRAFSEPIAWCVKFDGGQILQRGKIARLSAVVDKQDCDARVWLSKVEKLEFPKPTCP